MKKKTNTAKILSLNLLSIILIFFLVRYTNALTISDCNATATGGVISVDGSYCVYTFLNSGNFIVASGSLNVSTLVVAGGGGGGGGAGSGGGGAGGLIYNSSYIATGIIGVVIGTGGDGGSAPGKGTSGVNSSFGILNALGGGGGGRPSQAGNLNGLPGGSGGGGGGEQGGASGTGGLGFSGQGNNGGASSGSGPCYPGAGGGGANNTGVSATGSTPGKGGDGKNFTIFNSTLLYYAGGGGAGGTSDGGCIGALGGLGGGGTGGNSTNVTGKWGSANSGSGGGGGGISGTGGKGANGIVIVRYQLNDVPPLINFTSPTELSGSYNRNIQINVEAVDSNLANITIYLYNSDHSLNRTNTTTTSPNYVNYSSLANGIYFFNATAYDLNGHYNFTETRNITVDTILPHATLLTPLNGSYVNNNNIFNTCYQESTNISSIIDGTCNLNYNGTYSDFISSIGNISIGYDKNWNSCESDIGFNATYIKPNNVTNAIWQVKGTDGIVNLTISDDCFNANVTILKLYLESSSDFGNTYWSCYNSTGLHNLRHTTTNEQVCEEAIIWNITQGINFTANLTDNIGIKNATLTVNGNSITTFTFVEGILQQTVGTAIILTDGTYNWFYKVYDYAGNSFTSQNNIITMDTINPPINFTSPTELSGSYLNRNNISINVISGSNVTSWWDNNWPYKKQITMTGANITLINGTVLVNVSYIPGKMNVDFSDIRFLDNTNTNEYVYYPIRIINNESALFKVKVTTLNPGENNNTINMYYGNPAATSTKNGINIYDNLIAYYPFDDCSGTNIASTTGIHNGTVSGGYNWINVTNNMGLGCALNLTGSDVSGVNFGSGGGIDNAFGGDNSGNYTWMFYVKKNGGENDNLGFIQKGPDGNALYILLWDTSAAQGVYGLMLFQKDGSGSLIQNAFGPKIMLEPAHVAFTTFGLQTYQRMAYKNGSFFNGMGSAYGPLTANTSNTGIDLQIGASYPSWGMTKTYNGTLDEFIIVNNVMSQSRIAREYNNNNMSMFSFGVEETPGSAVNLANITIYLYNSDKSLNRTTTTTTSPNYVDYTSLGNGIYYFNATVYDLAGNFNFTETRNITIDTISPNSTLLTPSDGSYTKGNVNFTSNLTDNIGIKNATLTVYNSLWTSNLNNGLISSYNFDEGSGTKVIDLVSGKDLTAYQGVLNWNSTTAISGNSLHLNTSNQASNINFSFTETTPFSFSLWIYRNNDYGQQQFIGSYPSGSVFGAFTGITLYDQSTDGPLRRSFTTYLCSDNGVANWGPLGCIQKLTLYPLPASHWIHIVTTYDGSKTMAGVHTYINGTEASYDMVNSIDGLSGTFTKTGIILGGGDTDNSYHSDYLIDDLNIWNRTLSSSEVSQIYNNGNEMNFTSKNYITNSNCSGIGGVLTMDGDYCVHTFTTNGLFNITTGNLNISVLVVAGGGGGASGGGGAGGLIYSSYIVNSSGASVIIGSGGAGIISSTNPDAGFKGGNSSFGSLIAIGGGGGGSINQNIPQYEGGGSGGGSGRASVGSFSGGNGIVGQGNNGGWNLNSAPYPSGGGGGAGQAGYNATSGSGNGGNGLQYSINGSNVYYAGGGGGGGSAASSCPQGYGGLGGGGNGSYDSNGYNGKANTGGGGGGAETSFLGGSGGSGIVIIRYLNPNKNTITFTPGVVQQVAGIVLSLVDGVYNWFYTVFDWAGNSNNNPTIYNVTIGNSIPLINFTSPTSTSGSYSGDIKVNITTESNGLANITIYLYNPDHSLNRSNTSTTSPYYIDYTSLGTGIYYFNATVYDLFGNYNFTETRNVTSDTVYPIFSNKWDDSNNLTNFGVGHFNITVDNTNGTVFLHINSQTILATNMSANVYNVSYQGAVTYCPGTGGNVIMIGDTCIHTFTSNGTFTSSGNINAQVLVVAGGGGGGGGNAGGGGGAGGLIYNNSYLITGNETIGIGLGGNGGTAPGTGINGGDSNFGDLIAIGGGGGGRPSQIGAMNGNSGGSGGGGGGEQGGSFGIGGNGIVGQGNKGGNGFGSPSCYPGGGGGGANNSGSNGTNANPNGPGIGGDGKNYTISGVNVYYAAGGGSGGTGDGDCPGALGGLGGGGNGGTNANTTGSWGVDGTGSGGGGGKADVGGKGGSGIVIVSYKAVSSNTWINNNTYYWSAYGNGVSNNLNTSENYSYIVGNVSINLLSPPNNTILTRTNNVTLNMSLSGTTDHNWTVTFYNTTYNNFISLYFQDPANATDYTGGALYNYPATNAFDSNWNTIAIPYAGGNYLIYENFSIPTNAVNATFQGKWFFSQNYTLNGPNIICVPFGVDLQVTTYVYNGTAFQQLNCTIPAGSCDWIANCSIPNSVFATGKLQFETNVCRQNGCSGGGLGMVGYYEGAVIWTMSNVSIENSSLGVVTDVTTSTVGVSVYLTNLVYGNVFKWFVSITDGISTFVSDIFQFTPNNEPGLLNLRIQNISLTNMTVVWDNEPDMDWVAFRVGNDIIEVRSITSTADNWTVTGLFPNQQYMLEYQTGDKFHAISDYHGFNFRTLGWHPGYVDYPYRRLITVNSSSIGTDLNNWAVNVSLNEDNFQYFDGVNYVYYPSFLHLNYTTFNNIRFVDYYDIEELPYNVTYKNVSGVGGLSYQIIPNSYSSIGSVIDGSNAHDGNFGTNAVPNDTTTFIYNYTIPIGAKTTSMFRISDSGFGWDLQLPVDCYGPAGTDIAFKSDANRTGIGAGYVITYCQSHVNDTWLLVRDNGGEGPYFFETMMTWVYATQVNIEVIPRHFDNGLQKNTPGIDGNYNVQFWMYYGDPDAVNNESVLNYSGIDNNPLIYGPEETQQLIPPTIFYLNDTEGRTATGTNISWSVNQIVNNRLRISTNPFLLESYYFSYVTNTTQYEHGLLGNQPHTILTLTSPSEFMYIVNVTSSNSSYDNNYTINATADPVTITIPNLNTEEFLDWNFTYTENKTVDRQTSHTNWPVTNLTTNTQYWYEAIANGTSGIGRANGTFILGTLPSTPNISISNYSEYRPTKTVTICANLTDMNGNPSIDVSFQYWNQTDTSFKETSPPTTVTATGIVCSDINVNFGEINNYRAKAVGTTIGYSENYMNEVMPIQEFFAGNTIEDNNDAPLDRQYCPPKPDGTVNLNATCYEQKGYREGSLQEETYMYVETNVSTDVLTLHLFLLNGTSVSNTVMSTAPYGFEYTTLDNLGQEFYTFYITNSTGNTVLNWTKPGLTHKILESRRDVSKYVSFNGTTSPFNYTLMYFNTPGIYNTSSYNWCQNEPGGNLFDCMSVQYWGTFGNALSGTPFDRGQFFRGGVTNGETNDSGLLDYSKNMSAPLGDSRICFAFTVYYFDESKIPDNNITNYHYVYWTQTQHFSDFNGKIENATFHESYLFNFEYDTLSQTRDWKAYDGTDTSDRTIVKSVNASVFKSPFNQSLVVGDVRGFNVDLKNDKQYDFGLYNDGDWINQQIGKYQEGYIIFNLPDNATLSTMDSDGDGLSDFDEIYVYHTNPKSNDTDEDGMLDGAEITGGFDPLLYTSHSPPNITLINPANNSYHNTDQNFTANVTAPSGIASISLYINNALTDTFNVVGSVTSMTIGFVKTLSDGIYSWFYVATDINGLTNSSNNYTVTIDKTNPLISYTLGTADPDANLSQNFISVGVTVIEINEANITFNLYYRNLTSVNSTTLGAGNRTFSWTGLSSEHYSYQVTDTDLAGNYNSTEIRNITLDTVLPSATLLTPINDTYTTNTTQNFTVNITDNLGIKNATLYIYNQTGIYNQTTYNNFQAGTLQSTIGISVILVDNAYNWFYKIMDWASNSYITNNNTIIVDTTYPTILYTVPSMGSGGSFNVSAIYANLTATDANLLLISSTLELVSDGLPFSNTQTLTPTNIPSDSVYYNWTGLGQGIYRLSGYATDKLNHTTYVANRTIIIDMDSPIMNYVFPTPADTSIVTTNNFIINVTAFDPNLANQTIYYWYLNNTVQTQVTTSRTNTVIQNNIQDGTYYFNATGIDNLSRVTWLPTRSIVIEYTNQTVTGCRILAFPHGNYIVQTDLISTTTCLNVIAPDVTIYCNGHSITGNDAILATKTGLTLRDCNLISVTGDALGIKGTPASVNVYNTTFTGGTYGINVASEGSLYGDTLTFTGNDYGIYFNNSNNANYLKDITMSGNFHDAITFVNSSYNSINNLKIGTTTDIENNGIVVFNISTDNTFNGCNITALNPTIWGLYDYSINNLLYSCYYSSPSQDFTDNSSQLIRSWPFAGSVVDKALNKMNGAIIKFTAYYPTNQNVSYKYSGINISYGTLGGITYTNDLGIAYANITQYMNIFGTQYMSSPYYFNASYGPFTPTVALLNMNDSSVSRYHQFILGNEIASSSLSRTAMWIILGIIFLIGIAASIGFFLVRMREGYSVVDIWKYFIILVIWLTIFAIIYYILAWFIMGSFYPQV